MTKKVELCDEFDNNCLGLSNLLLPYYIRVIISQQICLPVCILDEGYHVVCQLGEAS